MPMENGVYRYLTLDEIVALFRKMPNHGAVLNVGSDGAIGNDIAIIIRFPSKRLAERALANAGFVRQGHGWKLQPLHQARPSYNYTYPIM